LGHTSVLIGPLTYLAQLIRSSSQVSVLIAPR
jgi:hypothetical protein